MPATHGIPRLAATSLQSLCLHVVLLVVCVFTHVFYRKLIMGLMAQPDNPG